MNLCTVDRFQQHSFDVFHRVLLRLSAQIREASVHVTETSAAAPSSGSRR